MGTAMVWRQQPVSDAVHNSGHAVGHEPWIRDPAASGLAGPHGLRPIVAVLLMLLLLADSARAGYREQGNMSVSLGLSAAHTSNYEKDQNDDEYEGLPDDSAVEESGSGDYSDVDLSVYLSCGYFLVDRLEAGISLSAMYTWYSADADRDDSSFYDGGLYSKYFFNTSSSFTPFIKLEAGVSVIDTGGYEETDVSAGGSLGIEYSSMSPVTWFAELSSRYMVNEGDLEGHEWRNQIYIGVSCYLDLFAKRGAFDSNLSGLLPSLDKDSRSWLWKEDRHWNERLQDLDHAIERDLDGGVGE